MQSLQDSESDKKNSSAKCTGVLLGGSVLVQSPADVTTLLTRGFYGKGIFSRSIPSHVQQTHRQRGGSVSAGGAGPERKRVRLAGSRTAVEGSEEMQRRRLQLHAEWREEKERLSSSISQSGREKSASHPSTAKEDSGRPISQHQTEGQPLGLTSSPVLEPTDAESDPYPVQEPLSLTSEEAFYLVAETNLLNVLSPASGGRCTTDDLWSQFCSHSERFPFTYTVYRHYRRKGWVPKSGLKYGIDFLLYKEGPDFYHSTYAILVREETASERDGSTLSPPATGDIRGSGVERETESVATEEEPHTPGGVTSGAMESPPVCSSTAVVSGSPMATTGEGQGAATADCAGWGLRWCDVVAHCRVCEAAAKELVVCSVLRPVGWSEEQLASSECVEELTIHEVSVTRWVPERER